MAAVVAATVLTLIIPPLRSGGGMYFLFLTAVVFSSLQGSYRQGIIAAVLSVIAGFIISLVNQSSVSVMGEWLVFLSFGLASGFTILLCHTKVSAENALLEAERKYRMIFEDAITGIYETSVDGKYAEANPQLARMFGFESSEQLINEAENLNARFYVEKERRKKFSDLVEEKGNISHFESEIYRRDGSKIWISENAVAVRNKNGKLIGFQGTTIEITDRKSAQLALENARYELEEKVIARTGELQRANEILRAEFTERERITKALRQSEEKFRTLVETGKDWIWETDAKGFYTYASPQIKNLTGYEPEEIVGKRPYDLMPPEEAERVKQVVIKLTSEKKGHSLFESLVIHKNGKFITTETSSVPIYDDHGNLCGSRGIARDITERKQTEAALRESELNLRSVITAAPVVLFAVDKNGIFTLSEGKALDTLGLKVGEVVGQSAFEIYRDFPNIIGEIKRTLSGESFTSTVVMADFVYETRYTPIFDADGTVTGIIGVSVDITEGKRIENELLTSQKNLRDLSAHLESIREEERKYLARELHDELGQTLTALKIDLTKLGEKIPNFKDAKIRSQVLERIPAMLEIVDTAMETTQKIISALRPGVLDELGLAAAVEWLVQEFQNRTAIKCGLKLDFEDDGLPQNIKTAMFRILQECLTNITRHAAADKVLIELKNAGDFLILTVEDNGRGIGKNKLQTTKSFGVAGMRERAFLLDGIFEISRPEKGGTRISVKIPRRIDENFH